MRGIEAGDLRGYLGITGRGSGGQVERAALGRTDGAGRERVEGPGRARAFAAFTDAVLGGLRPGAVGSDKPASGVRPDIDAVAVALRDALAADTSPGAVDALLKKVDDAVRGAARSSGLSDEAAGRLTGEFRSALADRVDVLARELGGGNASAGNAAAPAAPASAATTGPAPAPAPAPAATPTRDTAPTSAVATASYRVVQKTGIELLTQEGDVVRISLRTKEGFRASGGYSPTGAYLDVAAYSKARFTVEVQGSLSADELAAIDDVLGQVDRIAADFYSGDTARAFAAGAALDVDADQLAAVSLRLSQSTNLRIASRAERIGLPAPLPAPTPTPLPAPTPTPLPAATAVPTPVATTGAATTGAATSGPAVSAVEANSVPTPVAAASTAPTTSAGAADTAASATVLRSMTDYLTKLVDTLGSTTRAGRIEFSARAKLQLVVTAVETARLPEARNETGAAQLLANVVGATTDRRAV